MKILVVTCKGQGRNFAMALVAPPTGHNAMKKDVCQTATVALCLCYCESLGC